jgi:ADP-ribose pyrophosphatase
MEYFEKQISTKTVYKGRIVNVRSDMAELHNGAIVPREVVEHPGGVAIVPVNEAGRVIMVRQFRYPLGEGMLEIPAGKLEAGEDPHDCALRELSEETGCSAGQMVYLGPMYPSPGFSQEILHLYLATALEGGQAHPDENEFLSVETYTFRELEEKIMSGEIRDGKTIVGIYKAMVYLKNKEEERFS